MPAKLGWAMTLIVLITRVNLTSFCSGASQNRSTPLAALEGVGADAKLVLDCNVGVIELKPSGQSSSWSNHLFT